MSNRGRGADGGFLDRWSNRKRGLAGDEVNETEAVEPSLAMTEGEKADEKTDEEWLDELGLPEPESLAKGDDFSQFMTSAVPARLRNRALRRLWLSNPVLANLDEMVDYGEDFTDAATVIENLKTAYDINRGWLPKETEETQDAEPAPDLDASDDAALAEDGAAEEAGNEQNAAAESPDQTSEDTVNQSSIETQAADTGADVGQDRLAVLTAVEPASVARPRRMRFKMG